MPPSTRVWSCPTPARAASAGESKLWGANVGKALQPVAAWVCAQCIGCKGAEWAASARAFKRCLRLMVKRHRSGHGFLLQVVRCAYDQGRGGPERRECMCCCVLLLLPLRAAPLPTPDVELPGAQPGAAGPCPRDVLAGMKLLTVRPAPCLLALCRLRTSLSPSPTTRWRRAWC